MLISKTYQTVTYESADHGDFEETGFSFEAEKYGFKELIDLIESDGFSNEGADWLETVDPDIDYRTGEKTTYNLHFDRDNRDRDLKYWVKAVAYCGRKRK